MNTLLVAAGDASGDLHAAGFVRAFAQLRPRTRFVGMGGAAMEAAGVELMVHQRELALGGLFELARGLGGITRAWRRMCQALESTRPDLVVLVDSGGFNLPFARRVRRCSAAPLLYYVAPQVWAWRPGRIRKLASRIDRLAVIFPFEQQVYAHTRLPVDFVGHPLVEELGELAKRLDRRSARAQLGLAQDGPLVVLLPGSRRNELKHHLPLQLEAARQLYARDPRVAFVLALAPPISKGIAEQALARARWPESIELALVSGHTREAILAADVALAKPGTVTVESALLNRPMVVMGRVNELTAMVLRRAVRVPFYGMPNLIAERRIVPEFLQRDATPERMADALQGLIEGPVRERQLADLAEVRARLGSGGAAKRASRIAEEMLGASEA
jgi:lipid-A-disaccharide synthase